LSSLLVLVVYRLISSPERIRNAKQRIKANILAIRLYKDFGAAMLTAFLKSLWHTLKYFGLNLIPLLVLFPVLFLLFVQMDIRYGMRPFRVNEAVQVKARFNDAIDRLDIELVPSPYYRPLMNPVFVSALNEVNWKVAALRPGQALLLVRVDGRMQNKSLIIGDQQTALSNQKMRRSNWAHFLYPAEERLSAQGKLESISLQYPGCDVSFLGLRGHWLFYYIVLMLIFVLALKKRFGVEF